MERYAYLIWSLVYLVVWVVLYVVKPGMRRQMVALSLIAAPLGLSEPLFVPEYWSPPHGILDISGWTGFNFDIESLIFCFAIGGIGPVLYQALAPKLSGASVGSPPSRLRYHCRFLAALCPAAAFVLLEFTTGWNPVYTASLAMFVGAVASLLCRPDLKTSIWVGGAVFLLIYFVFFKLFDLAFPGYIERVWSLPALSGVLLWGIPVEECLFAVSFGMMWSSLYEHLFWPVVPSRPEAPCFS